MWVWEKCVSFEVTENILAEHHVTDEIDLQTLQSIDHYNMEIDLDEIIRRFARLHPRRMALANVWMTQKPRKGNFRELKSKKLHGGACPRTPLEPCAFGARLGNRSPFILDPRLQILLCLAITTLKCVAGIGAYMHVFDVKQKLLLNINYWK